MLLKYCCRSKNIPIIVVKNIPTICRCFCLSIEPVKMLCWKKTYYCFLPDICFVCSNFVSNVVVTLRDIQLYNVDTMWNMHLCIAEKKSLEWEGQLATMVFIYILVCVTSIIWCDCIVPEEEIICTSDCNSDFVRCNQDCNQDMECQNQCLRQITICVENCPCHENCLNGCPCSSYCESQTPSGIKHDFETEDLNVLGYRKSVNDKSV